MLSTILAAMLLLSARGAIGAEYKIRDAKDFVAFSVEVNSGKTFKGTTVLLENDIVFTDELSEQLHPIGVNGTTYFLGILDGQGYKISNLKLKSSKEVHLALFGYSKGLTIRNVVLDDTCSFTSSFGWHETHHVGAFIGYCLASENSCILENNVNMAPVTFDGEVSFYIAQMYFGGLAGQLVSYSFVSITNCANYGTVTHSGISDILYMGGIAGEIFEHYDTGMIPVKNNVNYGAIIHTGKSQANSLITVGGITGTGRLCFIENCVNYGVIKTPMWGNTTGSIVCCPVDSQVSNSYWNGKVPYGAFCADCSQVAKESAAFDEDTYKLEKAVTVGKYSGDSLLSALNAYVDANTAVPYSHWATNKGGNAVIFTVNGGNRFILKAKLIVLPNLAKEGKKAFAGWYTDSACKNPLKEYEINSDKFLYGTFK